MSVRSNDTVTDGVYPPIGTQWNLGTVFWTGAYGADAITITLNLNLNLNRAAVVNQLVPEPAGYAMLGAGLALVGFAARRRQRHG